MSSTYLLSMKSLLGERRNSTTANTLSRVDAFEFITGSEYMNEDLYPFQRVVIKMLYGLWPKYPPDVEEQALINLLKQNWNITIDLDRPDSIQHFILVAGRRSTKTTISSHIVVYSLYELRSLGNPQKYYGLQERQPIHVLHVACKESQAQDMFGLTSDRIRRLKVLNPYIDPRTDNRGEMRLFTPHDIELNREIERQNDGRREGEPKKPLHQGSLVLESVASVGSSNRGHSVYVLVLSEFAHMQRPGTEESQSTDHALYVALEPSLKDFGRDGKILMESTPKEKDGEFYRHYCLGGGMEQTGSNGRAPEKSYQVIQAATWEANPRRTREDCDLNFKNDPIAAEMEYGAHFGEISQQYASPGDLVGIIDKTRPFCYTNETNSMYVIAVDPGGRSHSDDGDAYAYSWGRFEKGSGIYVVDGMKAYNSLGARMPDGRKEYTLVDPMAVTNEIAGVATGLGGPGHVREIVYDQHDSGMAISYLKQRRFSAHETTFTNEYKERMYSTFSQIIQSHRLKVCWDGVNGFADQFMRELEHFRRVQKGDKVYYSHSNSGPNPHDDLLTAVANAVYRLSDPSAIRPHPSHIKREGK